MERRKFIKYEDYPLGGAEGTIKITKNGLYKKFHHTVPLPIRKRKEKVLLYLETIEELKKYYPEIRFLVEAFFSSYLKGYVMEPVVGGEVNSTSYTAAERLKALKDIKEILALFRKCGLYYFDIRIPNILLNNDHNPILLDIDSTIFEGENLDAVPYFLKKSNCKVLNENTQILMFNHYTLNCITQFDLETYFDIDKEGRSIVEQSIIPSEVKLDSAFDHEYLIDHMKLKRKCYYEK